MGFFIKKLFIQMTNKNKFKKNQQFYFQTFKLTLLELIKTKTSDRFQNKLCRTYSGDARMYFTSFVYFELFFFRKLQKIRAKYFESFQKNYIKLISLEQIVHIKH